MTRRSFLLSAAPAPRPNILLILTDDLGFADLSCYGARDIKTPNIDRLARQGLRFTHSYSNAPVCSPTRAALMTGLYPHRLGIEYVFYGERTAGKGLSPSTPTLPSMLKAAGYRTAMAGKWHLGAEDEFAPNRHGFDDFFGFRNSDHDYYAHRNIDGKPDLYENGRPVVREGYSTDLFATRAVDILSKPGNNPVFLYAAFNAPHWPFQAPGEPGDVRTKETWMNGDRAAYVRMVENLDSNIGRILDAAPPNTFVLFANDNGGDRLSDNAPHFHHKFTLWEGGIRVPMILRWPGRIPPGSTSPRPAITTDLTATILSAAGVSTTRPLDGVDLLRPEQPRSLFWRYRHQPITQRAVRSGPWKLLQDAGYNLLFNLESDPAERTDLSWRYPAIVQKLLGELSNWEAEMAASSPSFTIQ